MPFPILSKFLEDPCLRLTPSYCQNDPFEFGFSESDINALDSIYRVENLGSKLRDYSNLHGIISLTSSKNNIQMWSHYADSHKGAVVELLIDDSAPQTLFVNSTGPYAPPFRFQDFMFEKVNYSKTRHYNNSSNEISIEAVRKHYYFTKAREWIKEDEYRFIIPLTWINRIVFNENGLSKAKEVLGSYSDSIFKLDSSDKKHTVYELNPASIEYICTVETSLLVDLWWNSTWADTAFLIRLDSGLPGGSSGQVSKIFLGYNASVDDFIRDLENKRHDGGMSIHDNYIDIMSGEIRGAFKAEIDENEYKLLFNEICK